MENSAYERNTSGVWLSFSKHQLRCFLYLALLSAMIVSCSNSPVTSTVVSEISAGRWFSLALDTNGSVWSWGWNEAGQLGTGKQGYYVAVEDKPALVSSIENIIAISAGGDHGLALGKGGAVWAWGQNYHGELGNGESHKFVKPAYTKPIRTHFP